MFTGVAELVLQVRVPLQLGEFGFMWFITTGVVAEEAVGIIGLTSPITIIETNRCSTRTGRRLIPNLLIET